MPIISRVLVRSQLFRPCIVRALSSAATKAQEVPGLLPHTMSAWQITGYNGINSLEFTDNIDVPPITQPNEVLVQVKSASVNAIDVMMTEGYGQQLFKIYNELNPTNLFTHTKHANLPLTLGRDFAGVVQAVGEGVKNYKPGDQVMGVIPPPLSGSHKQYVVTQTCNIQKKPSKLTMEEAASIPYAGTSAWSALNITAELCFGSKDKKVLVMGASGGVGTIAVQLLKAWGSTVVSTCSADALPTLLELGSDYVIDYTSPEAEIELEQFRGFDVILDCTGRTSGFSYSLLKPWKNAKYVSLSPPVLSNFDQHGLVGGIVKNGMDLLAANSSAILEGKTLRWAFFVPSSSALSLLRDLEEQGKLRAVIDSVFPYDKLPDAYNKMKAGHTRGKVIIQM